MVVRGPGLTDAISGTDPLKDNLHLLQAEPLDGSPEVCFGVWGVGCRRWGERKWAGVERRVGGGGKGVVLL